MSLTCSRVPLGQPRCRKRTCAECGVLWAGDTRVRVRHNLALWPSQITMLTLTGPGRDQLPDQRARWAWNASAPRRFTTLHRRARQSVKRRHGTAPLLLAYAWEYQRRGVLHLHVVLGVRSPAEHEAARLYGLELDRSGGFGFADGGRRNASWRRKEVGPKLFAGLEAANYLAKYIAPLQGGKASISETVRKEDCPARPVYVARHLTRRTGVTMRWLRYVRFCHAQGLDPGTPLNPTDWSAVREPEDPWKRFQRRAREAGRCPP